ncbi:MAG TPA: hypothetical protein VF384_06555 [Planctomycetota bacterium]
MSIFAAPAKAAVSNDVNGASSSGGRTLGVPAQATATSMVHDASDERFPLRGWA